MRAGKLLEAWKRPWVLYWAVAVMVSMLPTLASYLGNRYQVSIQDLIVPVIVNLMTAGLVGAVFYRLWRRDRVAGYLALTLALLITTSSYDTRISPLEPLWQAVSPMASLTGPVFVLVVTIAILALCWWVGKLFARLVAWRQWKTHDVAAGIVVAITVTFGFEFLTLARDLAVEWPQFFYHPPALAAAPAAAKTAAKPDIYYIVLDRYASPDVLKNQFGYDDSDFLQFLKDNQFYVNDSAHNNYPYTTMSIASTMDGDYLNDIVDKYSGSSEQTVIPFNETIRKSPVAAALKSVGYKYTLVGNWYETSNLSPLADQVYQQTGKLTLLGHSFTLNNYSKIALTQSMFSRLLQMGLQVGHFKVWSYTNMGDVEMAQYQLNSLKNLAQQPSGGRFIFAHILIPHDPYNFNADGSINTNSNSDNYGEPVKQKYLNQVKYISGQMKDVYNKINAGSKGKAVVVMQSDEGPYPFQLNDDNFDQGSVDGELQSGDMRNWSDSSLQMKLGNLAAYHIPAADFNDASTVAAADSVNIFRLLLNSYFDYDLPYRPDCYFVYPNGRGKPESFASVTTKLTGQSEDERCESNGSVKP